MMMAWVAYPWALLGALAVPVLIGVYLLRARPQPRVVPSLLVWRMVVRTHESGRRPVLQRVPWIALLESVIIALLVLAAAGVRAPRVRADAVQALVLDDSASMRAPGLRGGSARAAALEACERVVQEARGTRCVAVRAGRGARLLPNASFSRAILERSWHCRAPAAALDDAIALALRLAGSNALVHVFTDAMPSNHVPGRVAWHALGTPAENCAIAFAGRGRAGTTDVCAVDVANYSAHDCAVPVTVRFGTNDAGTQLVVKLEAGTTGRVMQHVPRHQPVTFELPPDALPDDNTVTLLPEPARGVRVQVDVGGPARVYIERALRASGKVQLVSSAPHLLITTNTTFIAPDECWTIRVYTGQGGAALAGPFLIAGAHPACEGVALQHAVWGAVTNHLAGFPLIAAGACPLLAMELRADGVPQLNMQWAADSSTVQTMPAWPVLWDNLVRWRRTELPGIKQRHVALGESVQARLPRGVMSATMIGPDGAPVAAARTGDSMTMEPQQAGLHRLQAGTLHDACAVNFLAPAESDLRRRGAGAYDLAPAARMEQMQFVSYAWLCAVAALALLGVHQWWLARAGGAPE